MANDPSLWDLQNLIERNHSDSREDILDLKAQLATAQQRTDEKFRAHLLREVFDAKESAMLQRIGALEESSKATRTQVRAAVMTAVGAVLSTVIGAVIISVILKGGKP